MASLRGKVAIVTGSSSGIGRAIAERLAEDGAIVVVNYGTSAERAQQVVTGIQAKGGKAVAVQADMSQVVDARRLVIDTVKQFGRLDILVNNAGKFMSKSLMETTEEEFDQVMALHAKGPYFAMQEAAKVLKEGGRIVNISTLGRVSLERGHLPRLPAGGLPVPRRRPRRRGGGLRGRRHGRGRGPHPQPVRAPGPARAQRRPADAAAAARARAPGGHGGGVPRGAALEPARDRLYQSVGFVRVGVRKAYYQAPGGREDALVLKLDLAADRDRLPT